MWRSDDRSDIHRQNIQKARAMARLDIYDRLPQRVRDVFKEKALPVEPTVDDICNCVVAHGAYLNKAGRLVGDIR